MPNDFTARALATRSLARTDPSLGEFGTLSYDEVHATRIAFRDAFSAGAKRIALEPGIFFCSTIPADETVTYRTPYQQPGVILPQGFKRLDGRGAELFLDDGRGIHAVAFATWGWPVTVSYLASPVAAGDQTLQLEPGEGAKWQVGDAALWRFGSLPFDVRETLDWGIARVTAITGDSVTLDRPLPAPFDPASVAGQEFDNTVGGTWFNKGLFRWPLFDGLEVTDLVGSAILYDDYLPWVEEFLTIRGARQVRIARCGARRVGIGFALQYVEGATLTDCWAEDSAIFQPSVGKGINLAECRDIEIRNFRGKGLRRFINLEAGAEARVVGGAFENTGKRDGSSYGAECVVFNAVGRSSMTVRDFTVTGYGGYILSLVENGNPEYDGQVRFEGRLTLIHPSEPHSLKPHRIGGLLDYRIAGGRELWDFARPRSWRRRIYLKNGMLQNLRGPRGIVVRMRVFASHGLTIGSGGSLTGFYVGREGANGNNMATQLVAGADAALTFAGGTIGSIMWSKRAEQIKLLVQTAAGNSLDTADAFIDVECDIAENRLVGAAAWSQDSDARNSGPGGELREAYFPGYNIPSISAGSTLTIDFAIPSMTAADLVESIDHAGSLGNVTIRHMDSVAGALRVTFENLTGAAIDPASADIRIGWRKSLSAG